MPIETFNVQAWAIPTLREALKTVPGWNADMASIYYCGAGSEDADGVMQVTAEAIAAWKAAN